ncbi:hypothetical protein [Nitrospirillum sp. BR 11828]|uniref:hypothetical protein n=1 Tax=Nitrospirillum sp. BR 11828 TaxID=3104325 RepID=UPI002ACAA973|nr:hypothetical protein [Nitrospirillum sp. BR 11828]MDZ5647170.1 hypothetical protein [Nitrospirillum sp. BR 11828]
MNKKKAVILGGVTVLFLIIAILCTQITIFVIQPIGAIPDGKTLIISRLNKMQFIDSADAMCDRVQGGVSLLCRSMLLGTVAQNATIYLRLPYSKWLYTVSTDGKEFDR